MSQCVCRKLNGNAVCRRAKAALLSEDLATLDKLVKKGKKITTEIVNDRISKASLCVSPRNGQALEKVSGIPQIVL